MITAGGAGRHQFSRGAGQFRQGRPTTWPVGPS